MATNLEPRFAKRNTSHRFSEDVISFYEEMAAEFQKVLQKDRPGRPVTDREAIEAMLRYVRGRLESRVTTPRQILGLDPDE